MHQIVAPVGELTPRYMALVPSSGLTDIVEFFQSQQHIARF